MLRFIGLLLVASVVVACLQACSSAPRRGDMSRWVSEGTVPIAGLAASGDAAKRMQRAFDDARVVGLGEATHGQHESFEAKRAITMHLIEHHGYRIVAYEASASRAELCNAYVSGASDDLDEAMRGFGMMIWAVEENAQLLRDLRAWNQRARPHDRVRFVGVDVQDTQACATRLAGLLESRWANEAAVARSISDRLDGTVQQMFGGDRAAYDDLVREHIAFAERIQSAMAKASMDEMERAVLRGALLEFEGGVHMFLTSGGRDRAMSEMMLLALESSGPDAKAVLWAHNGHITKSPMRYANSDELAAGGHLATTLGERYYAIGFAFGSGEFVANDNVDGKWIFRSYNVDEPPEGSLESWFASEVSEPSVIDLRSDSGSVEVERWKRGGHGQRWAGGYRVPEDIRETSRDVSKLMATYPREAFDALVYLPVTRGSTPRR